MQNLVLLRGCPGAGKTTFIKEHGLEPYTLSADKIRMQVSSPILSDDGKFVISQKQDKYVWETLMTMLEKRMRDGCFTIIDATHYKTSLINVYKPLVKKYGYRVYIVDFTDVSYNELLRRNSSRTEYERVPVEVIKKMRVCFTNDTEVKTWCKIIKPEEFEKTFVIEPVDLTMDYDNIYIFGDIHGCYTCFKNFVNKHPLNDRTLYIFVGDYTDRGLENKEMVQWLLDNYKKPNIKLLKSNHTIHLDKFANEEIEDIKSKEFKEKTAVQLSDFNKKDLRQLCRKFIQMSFFRIHNFKFLVTHGGVPAIDFNKLAYIPTSQFIHGVGKYENSDIIDKSFRDKYIDTLYYSIHGHRNINNVKTANTERTFNLDSSVEYGNPLRVLHIKNLNKLKTVDFEIFEEPNPVHIEKPVNVIVKKPSDIKIETMSNEDIVKMLCDCKNIVKKELNDGYCSFNFSRDVFYKRKWNDISEISRGLFIHLPSNKIVARSYRKFFNIGERPETSWDYIKDNAKYPINVYLKYNGFLGLLSYDFVYDDFFIATKSTNDGIYKNWFKNILENKKLLTQDLKQYIKENNVTFVFEVIDPINDPHIIEYNARNVVLLDIIHNSFKFSKYSYSAVVKTAKNFSFDYKQLIGTIYMKIKAEDLKQFGIFQKKPFEGFVLEDSNNNMYKFKTDYYLFWKEMRSIKEKMSLGKTVNKKYVNAEWISFYKFCERQPKELLKRDIITLRKEWKKLYGTLQ